MRQRLYRAALHPLVSQLLLPPVVFILVYRIPFDTPKGWRKERISVYLTNLAIGGVPADDDLLLGWEPVLLVQLPVIAMASIIGVWLFSVQHRFEHSLWARQTDWTAAGAALHGSSWLRLPKVLQWFTGNIGFHHVHHLMPRVPNYRLQAAHRAEPAFAANVTGLTLWQALRAPSFTLWDEARARWCGFPGGALVTRGHRATPRPVGRPRPPVRRPRSRLHRLWGGSQSAGVAFLAFSRPRASVRSPPHRAACCLGVCRSSVLRKFHR